MLIDIPNPIDTFIFRMEQLGVYQWDFITLVRSHAEIKGILSNKLPLRLQIIRALHKYLRIPVDVRLHQR